ncbi:hypothetical protein [Nocardia farcinica]|uniref:hypothetical protein n=1 Tax=Nocardia farcinica TaxID=37329 RepID=UPI002456D33D|nr:hypothetical protein [Nocardia farcinica]
MDETFHYRVNLRLSTSNHTARQGNTAPASAPPRSVLGRRGRPQQRVSFRRRTGLAEHVSTTTLGTYPPDTTATLDTDPLGADRTPKVRGGRKLAAAAVIC